MVGWLLLISILTAAYFGFALVALTQAQHWRRISRAPPPTGIRPLALRTLGGLALVLSLALCLVRDGPSFGSLLWATAVSLTAAAVGLYTDLAPCTAASSGCHGDDGEKGALRPNGDRWAKIGQGATKQSNAAMITLAHLGGGRL